ncbi:MAG: esterase [Pseudomonadota bacterium]|nr:esterase [Pseudomonadota bacterium]
MNPAPGAPVTHLLYLHGFRSSPQSTKACLVARWMGEHRPDIVWACPQLAPSPLEAIGHVETLITAWPRERMAVVGSSLGGFYATIVAERTSCRAVVLNPAVDPARDLAGYIGELKMWHGDESFFFRAEYIDALQEMTPPRLTRPERYFAVIAKSDELLSWREMSDRYAGCAMRLIDGSDHALSDFDVYLPQVLAFLGLSALPPNESKDDATKAIAPLPSA